MTIFNSLTNRLFLAMSGLAIVSIAAATYYATAAVTAQAEGELRRGLEEAGALMDEYRGTLLAHYRREVALVADLPRFKATVELDDPPTMKPVAEDYRQLLDADLFLVTSANGTMLADVRTPSAGDPMDVVSVAIVVQPEILGTLTVGFALDAGAAARFRALTNSEIALGRDGVIHGSTLPRETWPALTGLLVRDGLTDSVRIGPDDYIATTRVLAPPAGEGPTEGETVPTVTAIILRSRTERLQFLSSVHQKVLLVAAAALLAAILASYAIARTVTGPLGAVTAAMREMARTGDLTRRITLPAGARWEDEDARLLATTFNTMTDSISRFQREAAQRERLSSLGRLSTVVAHEVRNPLMIIKSSLHQLRRGDATRDEVRAAVTDIDEEVARLNRIVSDILDFARPIKFDLAPVDLNALCADAAKAVAAPGIADVVLRLSPEVPTIVSDGDRLRIALVNVLENARQALRPAEAPAGAVRLQTLVSGDGAVVVEVADRGVGISPEDVPRIFDPFFTTRRTGTGLGLAITRNIIEGLGGTITIASTPGRGTTVRLVFHASAAESPAAARQLTPEAESA
jgi:signal transduction histidine kinase